MNPVTVLVDHEAPIVLSDNGVIEHFGSISSSNYRLLRKTCHNVANVLFASSLSGSPNLLVSTNNAIYEVHEEHDGGSNVSRALMVSANKNERIDGFALDALNNIFVALSTRGSSALTLLEYPATASGFASPAATFRPPGVKAPISAIEFSPTGRLYVYDAAGTIFEVKLYGSGHTEIVRRIDGTPPTLNRSPHTLRGKRPLVVAHDGNVYAATDRTINVFDTARRDNSPPNHTAIVGDWDDYVDALSIDGHDRTYVLTHSVTGDEAPVISVYEKLQTNARALREHALKEYFIDLSS